MELELTREEVRVLGVLIEKEMTTPEYYPLSLNALLNACNQKSNRFPVVSYTEEEVEMIVGGLKKKQLIVQNSSSRAIKYEERFTTACKFIGKEVAVLSVLMLRGPQTAGEIKSRSQRIFNFESLDEVHETITDLIEESYITKLSRRAGQKEVRFCHLLSGTAQEIEEELENDETASAPTFFVNEREKKIEALEERVNQLEEELHNLKNLFDSFRKQFE